MAKRVVSPNQKLQAVLAVYNGNLSFEESAAKHGVSQSSVYVWHRLFLENVDQLFRPRKPGPKTGETDPSLISSLANLIELLITEVTRLHTVLSREKIHYESRQMQSSWFVRGDKKSPLPFGKFLESGMKLLAAPLICVWNAYNNRQGDIFDTEIELNAAAASCPHCTHHRIWKNGSYHAVNYIFKFLFRFLPRISEKVYVQRYICARCKRPVHSFLKVVNSYCRRQFHQRMLRALAYCKFYLGLSLRKIQGVCQWFFQHHLSLDTIARHLDQIGQRAGVFFEGLSSLPQKTAHVLLLDEMFIKIKKKTAYLCLAIDEYGLIRGLRLLASRSAEELKKVIGQTLGPHFQPTQALTDFWKGYDEALSDLLGKSCSHYHDVVHAMRICFRYLDEAIRKTRLILPTEKRKTMSSETFKNLTQLKKRMVRAQLQRIMKNLFAVFSPIIKDEQYSALSEDKMIFLSVYQQRSALVEAELAKLDRIPGAGAQHFKQAVKKFFNKYLAEFVELLLDAKEATDRNELLPTTTNAIESKNSLFKPVIKIIKSFRRSKKAENLFCGVALFQNYRIDTRGKNKGTSAIQRAKLQSQAKDFFEAVGLKTGCEAEFGAAQ